MKELLTILGLCLVIALLTGGLMTWIIEVGSSDYLQRNGLKGVAERVWYGDSSPTPTPTPTE